MQIKVYVPKHIDIPNEYLPPLAQRAFESLGDAGKQTPATRGHLVRQAIRDGLLRDLDELVLHDGGIDLFCDPQGEIALEIDNRTLTLSELLVALHNKRSFAAGKREEPEHVPFETVAPRRRAA